MSSQAEEEPVVVKQTDDEDANHFDLFFLRWSLMVDGILTMGAAFATQGWHIYVGKQDDLVYLSGAAAYD